MTQVVLSESAMRIPPDALEEYLQGSGKPANAPFSSLDGYTFSWGEHYNPDHQYSRDPRTEESKNRKYSLVYVSKDKRPDFNDMSKAEIIAWVYEHFDIRYPSNTSKANMVNIAETI